jgi:hypothetical protein
MKMWLGVNIYVDGVNDPIHTSFEDNVDAEGTMVAKYVQPIIDRALEDFDSGPLDFRQTTVIKPWRIVAIQHEVVSMED